MYFIPAFGILMVVGLIVAGLLHQAAKGVGLGKLLFKSGKKPGRSVNSDGDLTAEELGKHYLVFTPPAVDSLWARLTRKQSPPQIVLGEQARYLHTQILGVTGTGKNYYALYPMAYQDINAGAGGIFVDAKGDMGGHLLGYAVGAGRGHDYRSISMNDPENSLTYSPLTGDDPQEVANRVFTALFQDDETATAFYREAALAFIRNFFGLCHNLEVLPTLGQLMNVAGDKDLLMALVAKAPKTAEGVFMRQRYLAASVKDYTQLFEGFVNKLSPLAQGKFAKVLNTTDPDIDMREIVSCGRLLHVGLATDKYRRDAKSVSTMLLMDLQSCLTLRYTGVHQPMFVYLDEFGDLVYPEFRSLVAKARQAKIGLVIAHQALGDLKAFGDAFTDSVFSSTSNKIFFRLGSAETAETVARLAGTRTVETEKISYSLDKGGRKAKGATPTEGEQFLFHPNDLKELGVGEAMLILQRHGGRKLYRSKLILAPEPPPVPRYRMAKPRRLRHFKALDLALGKTTVPAGPWPPAPAAAAPSSEGSAAMDLLSGRKKKDD